MEVDLELVLNKYDLFQKLLEACRLRGFSVRLRGERLPGDSRGLPRQEVTVRNFGALQEGGQGLLPISITASFNEERERQVAFR